MAKQRSDHPKFDIYEALIERFPDIPLKGAKNPYTSLNGNMFSFLTQEGMAVRVSKEDQQRYWDEYGENPVISHGAVMRGYIEIKGGLLDNSDKLDEIFSMSHEFAKTLKSKPTTKKK